MSNELEAAKRVLAGLGYTWDGEYWSPPSVTPPPDDDPRARDVALMLIVRTADKALFPENFDVSSARATRAFRRAVIANLPKVTRIIAAMDEELARLMFAAHSMAASVSGLTVHRPPPDYRAPYDRNPPLFP